MKRPPQSVEWPPTVTVDAMVERLIERSGRSPLFDGTFRLSGRHRGRRFSTRVIGVVEPDGRMYLEAIGRASFIIASDGVEIRAILPGEREWLRAPATAASVEALIGIPAAPDELAALIGRVGAPAADLQSARPGPSGRLQLDRGWLQLEPTGGEVIAGELGGELEFEHDPSQRLVTLRVARRELELELLLRDSPTDEGTTASSIFRPEPPAGFVELDLDHLVQPALFPE